MNSKDAWLQYEAKALKQGYQYLAGIDEAGRGPLAGPVVAACIHIPQNIFIEGVNDSKKLTPLKRQKLFEILTQHPEIVYAISVVDAQEIDRINILQAAIKAMNEAYTKMSNSIDYLLVDGVQLKLPVPSERIIKGDSLSHLIAAASILAKVTRDQIMEQYDHKWPEYGFSSHKGYGTKKHREAIEKYGPCEIHRKTFEPIRSLIQNQVAF